MNAKEKVRRSHGKEKEVKRDDKMEVHGGNQTS